MRPRLRISWSSFSNDSYRKIYKDIVDNNILVYLYAPFLAVMSCQSFKSSIWTAIKSHADCCMACSGYIRCSSLPILSLSRFSQGVQLFIFPFILNHFLQLVKYLGHHINDPVQQQVSVNRHEPYTVYG